jgi:hypothetical protein
MVSFSILTDPTYHNYRSPAGRSSLEMAAMKLCERYTRLHPGRIFYEDDNVRIYQFSQDSVTTVSDGAAGNKSPPDRNSSLGLGGS